MIKHIKRWLYWRKHTLNGPLDQIITLFRPNSSPTFLCTILPEELDFDLKEIKESIKNDT